MGVLQFSGPPLPSAAAIRTQELHTMVTATRNKVSAAARGSASPIVRGLGALPTLLALLACQVAAAQSVTLVGRETTQRGNFAVGFGTNTDNGHYVLDVLTLEPAFANVASDSGAAAGATANFTTAQSYEVFDNRVDFSGSAFTAIQAPPGVTAFADTLSQLELVLVLSAATPFELQVNIGEALGATVNNLAPRADAQFRLSGPGDTWFYNTAGSFLQTGVLAAGTWRINAFADTRGNGDASFIGTLLLAPVPEPATWLLMAGGIAALLSRRLPFAGHLP
jgi:hypothetical protein